MYLYVKIVFNGSYNYQLYDNIHLFFVLEYNVF